MSSEHTPEPWRVQTHYGDERLHDDVSDSDICVVLPEDGSYPEDIICEVWGTEHDDEANARRIVACVNACAGLPTESLENDGRDAAEFPDALKLLSKQRNELAQVLRDLVNDYEYTQAPMGAERIALWVNARIVLAQLGDKV